jgi:hypothetical protein
MVMITITLALLNLIKKIWLKLFFLVITIALFWLLILTVSRASFFALLTSVSILYLVMMFRKSIWWASWRWFVSIVFFLTIMVLFGDLSDRLLQVLGEDMAQSIRAYTYKINPPPVDTPEPPLTVSDSLPEPKKEEQIVIQPVTDHTNVPVDVYSEPVIIEPLPTVDEENPKEATSAPVVTYPTYSDTALKYGLSVAIRLDALWPRALAGFKSNPLFGSGYSTLTKERPEIFTYAESTDNDILRMLGETGLFGTISFLAILIILMWRFIAVLKNKQVNDPLLIALNASGIAICLGLLMNSVYIDVFEASKVAYAFWSVMGITLASGKILTEKLKNEI